MITNLQDYIRDTKLFKTIQVDELLFVEYKCLIGVDESHIWTHHNYFAYVLGGRKKWKTRHEEYLASSGETLFVKKGANAVYQYFEEPFLVLFIFLPDQFIKGIVAKHYQLLKQVPNPTQPTEMIFPIPENQVLGSFFQSFLSYFLLPKSPHAAILKLKLEELILSILLEPGNIHIKRYLLQLGREQKVDIAHIMRSNFNYPLSINDYARLCARSLSSFRRDFKATFNTTPAKWLSRERLVYSRFLLETTDKSLPEIIEESGFKNRSHFVKVFKNNFGYPPGQFRQLCRADN